MTKIFDRLKKAFDSEDSIHERELELLELIAKYEKKLEKEANSDKWKEIAKTIQKLKKEIQDLHENDPAKLKYRLEELNKELADEETKNSEAKTIKNYFQYIVEKNLSCMQKTSAEDLKNLVEYSSIDFDMIYEKIVPKDYSYDNNYLDAIENLYDLLEDEFKIITQQTPNYLLTANDILQLKSGNQADIAIFVCAMMHKLGDFNAKVVVALLDDFTTIHFVQTKYKYRTLIFDFYNSQKYNDYLDYDNKIWELYKPEDKTIREIKFSFNKFNYDEE
jgi:hypothetical protein